MANELPCPVGNALSNGLKQPLIQCSGDLNAESAIGCYESLSIDGAAKLSSKAAQNADLSEARPQIGLSEEPARAEWKSRAEWITQRPYTTITCCPQQRPQDLREDVGMLVRVNVRNRNSSRLNLLNLCPGLALDFTRIHTPCESTRSEGLESVAKSSRMSNC